MLGAHPAVDSRNRRKRFNTAENSIGARRSRFKRLLCAWRRSRRQTALEGDNVRKVVRELERLDPSALECRRRQGEGYCLSWLEVLVGGLQRYGDRSLKEVCANRSPEEDFLHDDSAEL
jgi:hypothetical protein